MRLIDADALKTKAETIQTIDCWHMRTEEQAVLVEHIDNAPTIDAIPVELVAEMFGNDEPCNFGLFGIPVDDFMCFECGDWCEINCDKVPAVECWKKFFEAWEERKDND